jgi:uncharacterized protein (TIGR02757 family)
VNLEELKELLEEKYRKFCREEFIESDPVGIPHLFEQKENIEISGFLSASIAWGQRVTIIKNAKHLMQLLHFDPHRFVINFDNEDLTPLETFCHRTFNSTDLIYFLKTLSNIYKNQGGLEVVFMQGYERRQNMREALIHFRKIFFGLPHEKRTEKHVANVQTGASAKRLNMFLRWMVRKDGSGVDFGIWKNISSSDLFLPLDIHTGNVARALGLLERKQNDWRAVEEITSTLRQFDPDDPVKYDYALFGMGIVEGIKAKM